MPPYSAGIMAPNNPSSFMRSTTACGYSSRCSISLATGLTSRSTKRRMVVTICCCSSLKVIIGGVLPVWGSGQFSTFVERDQGGELPAGHARGKQVSKVNSLWLMAYGKNYTPISQDATARLD